MHRSAFLVGGLKRAPQVFFLNFFVRVVLFGHSYGPVNQKKTHQNFVCRLGKSTSICAIDLAVQHILLAVYWTLMIAVNLKLFGLLAKTVSTFSVYSGVNPTLYNNL